MTLTSKQKSRLATLLVVVFFIALFCALNFGGVFAGKKRRSSIKKNEGKQEDSPPVLEQPPKRNHQEKGEDPFLPSEHPETEKSDKDALEHPESEANENQKQTLIILELGLSRMKKD